MLDMLDALSIWNERVKLDYPNLLKKVKSHYYSAVINSCQYLANKKDSLGSQKFEFYQLKINSDFIELISSEYISLNNKIKIILFKTRLFKFIFQLLHISGIKKYD
jgi:hypothetical protein